MKIDILSSNSHVGLKRKKFKKGGHGDPPLQLPK